MIYFLLTIFLLSLSFNPWQITVFLPTKNFVLQLGAVFFGLYLLSKGRIKVPSSLSFLFLLIFWFWSLLHLHPFSFRDFYFFLLLPFPLLMISEFSEKDLRETLLWVVILGTLLSVYGIFQHFGIDFSFWKGNLERNRVFGLFGNVDYFSLYLLFPFIVSFSCFLEKHGFFKVFFLVDSLVIGISIFFTFTRSVLIGLFLFIFFTFITHKRTKKDWVYLVVFFLIIFSVLGLFSDLKVLVDRIKAGIFLEEGVKRRILLWRIALSMLEPKSLIWGRGVGYYGYLFPYKQAILHHTSKTIAYYAHNEYLQYIVELGVVGLILFLAFVFFALKEAINIPLVFLDIAFGTIIAYLFTAFFSFPFHLAPSLFFFLFSIGIIYSFTKKRIITIPVWIKIVGTLLLLILLLSFVRLYLSHSYAYYKRYYMVVKLNPYWGEMKKRYAVSLLKRGNIDRGYNLLKEAEGSYIDFYVYYNLGVASLEKGDMESAKEYLSMAYLLANTKREKDLIENYMNLINPGRR